MSQRAVCSKDIRRSVGDRAAVRAETQRVGELVRLFAHAAGGRVSERLLTRLGMPVTDNAILRQLKSHVRKHRKIEPLRAIAIDDWSWRKGLGYGTIVVDLERRTVCSWSCGALAKSVTLIRSLSEMRLRSLAPASAQPKNSAGSNRPAAAAGVSPRP